jgi:uncharacterized membrane protein
MRREYFLVPNIETTREIVKELLLSHVPEKHIHLIANEDIPMEDLPEATLMQKSDFVPALEKGALGGAYTGLVAGLIVVAFPPAGLVVGGGAILALIGAGATVGGMMSALVGVGLPSSRLEQFEEAIKSGEILILVDIERQRVDEIQDIVKKHHPEVEFEGLEAMKPPFP